MTIALSLSALSATTAALAISGADPAAVALEFQIGDRPDFEFSIAPTLRLPMPVFTNDFTAGALGAGVSFTRASTASRVNPAGAIETVALNTPRFDYDPVSLAPRGLLIEEQSTNLITYSQQIDQWTKTGITVTADVAVAPSGATEADAIIPSSVAGASNVARNAGTTVGGNLYAYSVYAAQHGAGLPFLRVSIQRNVNRMIQGIVDLRDGACTFNPALLTSNSSRMVSMTAVPGPSGFWRIVIIGNPFFDNSGAADHCNMILESAPTALPYGYPSAALIVGDNVNGALIWGAQAEASQVATSYIATVAAQATRVADTAQIAEAQFAPIQSLTDSTLFVEGGTFNDVDEDTTGSTLATGVAALAALGTGNSYRAQLNRIDSTSRVFRSFAYLRDDAGAASGVIEGVDNSYPPFATQRAVLLMKGGQSLRMAWNGVFLAAGTGMVSGAIGGRLSIGFVPGSARRLNGHIRRIHYFNQALSSEAVTTMSLGVGALPTGALTGLNQDAGYYVRSRDVLASGFTAWSNVVPFRTPVLTPPTHQVGGILLEPAIVMVPVPVVAWTAPTAPRAGFPVENLGYDAPVAWISEGTPFVFEAQLGRNQAIDTIALLNGNFPEVATVTIRAADTLAALRAGTPAVTIGPLPYRASANVPGRRGYHALLSIAPINFAFISIEINGSPPGDVGYLEHAVFGKAIVTKNHAREKVESLIELGDMERTRSGIPNRRNGYRMRRVEFDIAMLTETQYETLYSQLDRMVGETGPVFIAPNGRRNSFFHDRLLYGCLSGGRVVNPVSPYFTKRFAIDSLT